MKRTVGILSFCLFVAGWVWLSLEIRAKHKKTEYDLRNFEREAVEAGVGKIERIWRPETGWRTEFRFRSPESEYKQGKLDGYREGQADCLIELRRTGELVPVPQRSADSEREVDAESNR